MRLADPLIAQLEFPADIPYPKLEGVSLQAFCAQLSPWRSPDHPCPWSSSAGRGPRHGVAFLPPPSAGPLDHAGGWPTGRAGGTFWWVLARAVGATCAEGCWL